MISFFNATLQIERFPSNTAKVHDLDSQTENFALPLNWLYNNIYKREGKAISIPQASFPLANIFIILARGDFLPLSVQLSAITNKVCIKVFSQETWQIGHVPNLSIIALSQKVPSEQTQFFRLTLRLRISFGCFQ